jgi:hypothetical protein
VRIEWHLSSGGVDVETNLYRISPDGLELTRVNEAPMVGLGPHVAIDTPPAGEDVLTYELKEITSQGERALGRIEINRSQTGQLRLRLDQNEPNPFASSTLIRFEVAEAGHLRLAIYDAAGRLVRVLRDGAVVPGSYTAQWDGRDARGAALPSGIYLYVAEAGRQGVVRRAVRVQ